MRVRHKCLRSTTVLKVSFDEKASTCLDPRGHGSAKTCSSTCTLSPACLLHSSRRDPLRDKIREVGMGLSLADTQTGRYMRLYSRRRLCARRGADAQALLGSFQTSSIFCDFSSFGDPSQRHTGIGTLLIPSMSRFLE